MTELLSAIKAKRLVGRNKNFLQPNVNALAWCGLSSAYDSFLERDHEKSKETEKLSERWSTDMTWMEGYWEGYWDYVCLILGFYSLGVVHPILDAFWRHLFSSNTKVHDSIDNKIRTFEPCPVALQNLLSKKIVRKTLFWSLFSWPLMICHDLIPTAKPMLRTIVTICFVHIIGLSKPSSSARPMCWPFRFLHWRYWKRRGMIVLVYLSRPLRSEKFTHVSIMAIITASPTKSNNNWNTTDLTSNNLQWRLFAMAKSYKTPGHADVTQMHAAHRQTY